MTNGVIIDAESGLLLIAVVGYQPNEYTNTHARAHTHLCMLSLSRSLSLTHFYFLQVLLGALMYINLPPQLMNFTQTFLSRPFLLYARSI